MGILRICRRVFFSSRFVFFGGTIFLFIFFEFLPISHSWAGDSALTELIDILRKNGSITPEQAWIIQTALEKDRKKLIDKERELREMENSLKKWHKSLSELEDTLKKNQEPEKIYDDEISTEIATQEDGPEVSVEGSKNTDEWHKEKDYIRLKASFRDGFGLSSPDEAYSMYIGALMQGDYRIFRYAGDTDPAKDKFDIRRARLIVRGNLSERFFYKFQYEFQGAGSRRLLDAYLDTVILPSIKLRGGQFKEPFSLEQYSLDQNMPFAERSMGFYITPGRDLGLMVYGSFWDDRICYWLGIFNGDGMDDSVGGDVDSPEWTGRLSLLPLKNHHSVFMENLHIGGSFSFARVDRNNVAMEVKTTGLTTFFNVASRAKYNIIRDAESRNRFGIEMAYAYGPVLVWGEYINLQFKDVMTSSGKFDIDTDNIYGAILWMVTGEVPEIRGGTIQAIRPLKNLGDGGWGALGIAFRIDAFDAGHHVYETLVSAGDSVRKATAYTLCLNWYLNPYIRLLLDATRTEFDQGLLIYKDPLTGQAVFSDREDVFTGRFQFFF